jgi:hypothetical protein
MKSASSVCIAGYTFRMKSIAWLVIIGALAGIGYSLFLLRKRWHERKQVAEARLATFVAGTLPQKAPLLPPQAPLAQPAVDAGLTQQRLLFDAAAKAVEAGEPALSIQIYARLLSRYPASVLAAQARAAVEAQKKKLAKG